MQSINQTAVYNWNRVTEPFKERKALYEFFDARENNSTVQKIRRELMEKNNGRN